MFPDEQSVCPRRLDMEESFSTRIHFAKKLSGMRHVAPGVFPSSQNQASYYDSASTFNMLCSTPATTGCVQAAQQHHAPSMMYLGKMCLYGQGFPVDYDMALLWFEKAAEEVIIPPPR